MNNIYSLILLSIVIFSAQAGTELRAPGCKDIKWSAELLDTNPDIRESCLGVFVRNNTYYARSEIELVRINPGTLTFRPVHRDGKLGPSRRLPVASSWRANIDGKSYRLTDLAPGQRLNVYIPEDRFALVVDDGSVTATDDDAPTVDSEGQASGDSESQTSGDSAPSQP